MPSSPKLRQGDVVLVPFPFADLSGQKMRPAVIVSGNPQGAELIVAFITSVLSNRSPRGAEIELLHSDPEFRVSGVKEDSLIRLDKLVTLSSNMIFRRLGTIGPATRSKTEAMLRRTFDLP
jgi:mRNA interferase MazF